MHDYSFIQVGRIVLFVENHDSIPCDHVVKNENSPKFEIILRRGFGHIKRRRLF